MVEGLSILPQDQENLADQLFSMMQIRGFQHGKKGYHGPTWERIPDSAGWSRWENGNIGDSSWIYSIYKGDTTPKYERPHYWFDER